MQVVQDLELLNLVKKGLEDYDFKIIVEAMEGGMARGDMPIGHPKNERENILEELHKFHISMEQMTRQARKYVLARFVQRHQTDGSTV